MDVHSCAFSSWEGIVSDRVPNGGRTSTNGRKTNFLSLESAAVLSVPRYLRQMWFVGTITARAHPFSSASEFLFSRKSFIFRTRIQDTPLSVVSFFFRRKLSPFVFEYQRQSNRSLRRTKCLRRCTNILVFGPAVWEALAPLSVAVLVFFDPAHGSFILDFGAQPCLQSATDQ